MSRAPSTSTPQGEHDPTAQKGLPEAVPLVLPPPPVLPGRDTDASGFAHLVPLTGAFGSVAMVVGVAPGGNGLRGLAMAGSVVASSLVLVLVQVLRQRTRRRFAVEAARAEHLHRLRAASVQVRADQQVRRQALRATWPSPAAHRAAVVPAGGAGLPVRLGTTTTASGLRCEVPDAPHGVPDPVCAAALDRFPRAHAEIPDVPLVLDLTRWRRIRLTGPTVRTEETARALVLNAARHPVEELCVAVLCTPDEVPRWDWTKWLPHTGGDRLDAAGPVRLVDHRPERLLARLPRRRHTLVVVSPGFLRTRGAVDAATWPQGSLFLECSDGEDRRVPAQPGTLDLQVGEDPHARSSLVLAGTEHPGPCEDTSQVLLDRCSLAAAAAAARRRAGRAYDTVASTPAPDVLALLTPAGGPVAQTPASLLRVPIGVTDDGTVLHLDLKEAAHGGHGPHGLLVGATGSGKSELLRTLVLGLVGSHLPDDLSLVLVDFKGGATFADVEDLPHVAACVTNLADDVTLVDRMQDALGGELERRQELLHATGHSNIHEYRADRQHDRSLPPLPHLFVCVDEFSELLTARPDFVDLFTAVGRLGRSLGIHLLLASQRLDEGRLHALEAHLSYRLALRTFSASESRAAIGIPDAHTLPRRPGAGLMRTGAETPIRFDTLHVGAPAATGAPSVVADHPAPRPFTVLPARAAHEQPGDPAPQAPDAPTVGTLVVARARAGAAESPPTRRIWLPPLDQAVALGPLLGQLARDDGAGLHSPRLREYAGKCLPFALVDRPRLQRRDVLSLDLSRSGGHVAVVGAPRSGRSTTLQTLVAAIALGRTPQEAVIHLLDLGNGALAPLTGLPHVVSHATRQQPDLVHRIVAEVEATLAQREEGAALGRSGSLPEVYLVVDGWGSLRQEFEEVEMTLVQLAPRALAVGLHLVLAAGRWAEVRPALLDVVGSRVELRLGDPFDSVVDRRAAGQVPFDRPGRGLAPDGAALLVATPALVPGGDVGALVHAVASSWPGPVPPRLRDLPTRVERSSLPVPPGRVLVGADEQGSPVTTAPAGHLVVTGPDGTGRTTALRHHVVGWLEASSPAGQVLLLDPRGTLGGLVTEAHLLDHAATADRAGLVLRQVAEHLAHRLEPGRHRTQPEVPVCVVVDDLDLLRDTGVDLSPLTPLLPRAQEIGLHLVVACRGDRALRSRDRLATLLGDLGAATLELTGTVPGRARLTVRGRPAVSVQCPAPEQP